ncbi:RsiG family protein [Nocardioides sp. SYSU DS0663]|uniref:RsiG family protein n=1 Tax=Nocardioides sp. SYSU DS0663 TaxID=3416445 RepID=UPI003F4C136D
MRAPHIGAPQSTDEGRTLAPAALADMSLPGLRAYRQQLLAEDDRVSYWRRLVHARLDLQEAGRKQDGPLDAGQIAAALRETGAGSSRQVFAPIASQAPLPSMPALRRFWDHETLPEDLDASLEDVEEELSAYRRAVHARLDEATEELVRRYREAPASALDLLPDLVEEAG